MNRDKYQTFEHSVELLEEIFPNENWVWILSRNLHGLTEGFDTIPFEIDEFEIMYQIADLESFAIEFGRGYISEAEIAWRIDHQFYSPDELDRELDELLGVLETPISSDIDGNPIQESKNDADEKPNTKWLCIISECIRWLPNKLAIYFDSIAKPNQGRVS